MIKKVLLLLITIFVSSSIYAEDMLQLPKLPIPQNQTVNIATPLTFMAQDFELWGVIEDGLYKLPRGSEIDLRVTGIGGSVIEGYKLVEAILAARANGVIVNMKVVGMAESMHAFMLCYANNVEIKEGSSILFHSVALDSSILFGLINYRDINLDLQTKLLQKNILAQCISVGRLNKEDLKIILNGGDVIYAKEGGKLIKYYINHDEASAFAAIPPQIIQIIIGLSLLLIFIALAKRI